MEGVYKRKREKSRNQGWLQVGRMRLPLLDLEKYVEGAGFFEENSAINLDILSWRYLLGHE